MSGTGRGTGDGTGWMWAVIVLSVVGGYFLIFSGGGEGNGGPEGGRAAATLELGEALGGADTAGYARALEPRDFEFPVDHGAHPDFRTEWWYLTNNLVAEDGRRFGVHFTIFRNALAPAGVAADTLGDWSTRQVYMGHFAVADVAGERFLEAERFTRGAAGLAGAEVVAGGATGDRLRVWMDDWGLETVREEAASPPTPGSSIFPLRLRARRDGVEVDLTLSPAKPLVLQGERGLSRKGDDPGNASFYYSFTRLDTRGRLILDGDTIQVSGTSWMDREWSTSALDSTQAGWDWFALQLDDGRDLMVYRLRGRDGSTDPLSKGVIVASDGTPRPLAAEDFSLEVVERWESPIDGAVYPSTWRVRVPGAAIDLIVEPVLRDQEMNVTVRYWEGAVDLREAEDGDPVGRGYVELTGYAGAAPPGG